MPNIPTKTVTTQTPSGRSISALMALPEHRPAPAVILIHAFQGLTDEFKDYAPIYAEQGYVALAIDLYDGEVGHDMETGFALMQGLDESHATETASAWVNWLKGHQASTGKVATVGWCFGGRWSLNTSLAAPVDATVIYYGGVDKTEDELKSLKGPVLGHFGLDDVVIPKPQVDSFEAKLNTAGHPHTLHWYEANHAFANAHAGEMYNEACARQADERTFDFLKETLWD